MVGCRGEIRAIVWVLLLLPVASIVSSCASCDGLPSSDLFQDRERAATRFDTFELTLADRKAEVEAKVARVRKFLEDEKIDGVLLTRETMFSWITGGGEDFIVHSTGDAQVKVLVTSGAVIVIANNIEAQRIRDEIVAGLGFAVEEFKFYEPEEELARIAHHCPDAARVATDATSPGEMRALTTDELLGLLFPLTPQELGKYRWLGRKCSEVLEAVADAIRPGMTEYDIQYLIAREMWYWDIFPTVNLASVDRRVRTYKHPFPEGATLKKYVNLNVCVRRWGMIISMSRLLHFGEPDAELREMFDVGGQVMASMLHATRPGATFADVSRANELAYAAGGQPDEWQRHLQGGPILTAERIVLLRAHPEGVITDGMALAYNPTSRGSKHEDTFVVTADGLEMLTPCINWPVRTYTVEGKEYQVPDLKVVR